MKDNYLTMKDKNGKKREYRILLDIEDTTKKVNYVIYTDDKKNKDGSIKAYASNYILSEQSGYPNARVLIITDIKIICFNCFL